MKYRNFIIKVVLLALVIVFLTVPAVNPLLSADTKMAVAQQLSETFGSFSGIDGVFNVPKLIALLAMLAGIWMVSSVLLFVLGEISERRKTTSAFLTLSMSFVKFAAVLIGLVWGLSILGANVSAIIASVGVVSLVVGFGAQSLIEDTITGIFMILENHFHVGDYIVLDNFRGRVKQIGIRTVVLLDDAGNLKIVNNSDIRNYQNRSQILSLAICDVGISYSSDIPRVEQLLKDSFEEMYRNNMDVFAAPPVYKGVEGLNASAVTLRITVETEEANVFIARRRLNREIKLLFDKNGVEIPFTQVVVHPGQ